MSQTVTKQPLASLLPEGQVVDRAWLADKGVKRPLVDYYLRSGALEPVARGAYRRPGPPLKWEHLVYSLRELGFPIHVGGRSALEQQGFGHYLAMQPKQIVQLYGVDKLPGWVAKVEAPCQFNLQRRALFEQVPMAALTTRPFGHWDWPVWLSTPELALLEVAAGVTNAAEFEVLDKLFEAATSLRPKLVMRLLETCRHIKAKRVFLWFADRHRFVWRERLDLECVDLGSGKRVVLKGGALDKLYLITVPRKMADGAGNAFS